MKGVVSYKRKVRRIKDGKVFSCPEGAARNYPDVTARLIRASCDKLIGIVGDSVWEWADDVPDKHDFGDYLEIARRAHVSIGAVYTGRSRKREVSLRKAKDSKYRIFCYSVSEFFKNYSGYLNLEVFNRTLEIYPEYRSYCISQGKKPYITSDTAFGKHLFSWKDFYGSLIGLELGYIGSRQAVRINKDLIVEGMGLYDSYDSYIIPSRGKIYQLQLRNMAGASPVYCYNTESYYPSLKIASLKTMVPWREIQFVCEGDIPFAKFLNVEWRFRYATWQDIDEKWLIIKYVPTLRAKPVYCLTNKTFYPSISAASQDTGVSKRKIKKFCDQGDPMLSPSIMLKKPLQDPTYWKFQYWSDEEMSDDEQSELASTIDWDNLNLG